MMEIFKKQDAINFMGFSKILMSFSIVLVLASLGLLVTKGLNYGIDFAGGTLVQVKYKQAAPIDDMRAKLAQNEMFANASITEFGSKEEVIVRIPTSSSAVGQDIGDITRELLAGTGEFEVRRVDMVGPKVGSELREKGLMAMVISIIAILIYIAFRFEWRFAIASVIALVHDISIAIGAIVLFNIDVNLDILAALLTLLGYSLNDTIIVFDRIREGIKDAKHFDLGEIINESVTKTLSRTTLTSLTTFFVILTLFLFGGEIIHGFGFTLLIGIIVGTYSSIFIASPVLQMFGFSVENYKQKEAEKAKREAEKQKMRAMYEQGTV